MNRFDTTLRRAFVSAVAGMGMAFSATPPASAQVFHDWTGNVNNEFYGIAGNWDPTFIPRSIDDIAFSGAPVAGSGLLSFNGTTVRQLYVLDSASINFRPQGTFNAATLVVGGGRTRGSGFDRLATFQLSPFNTITVFDADTVLVGAFTDVAGSGVGATEGRIFIESNTLLRASTTSLGTLRGTGTIFVRGGRVESTFTHVGRGSQSQGTVTVSGSASSFDSTFTTIGGEGAGVFTAQAGGDATLGQVIIGEGNGSTGRITSFGGGSLIEANNIRVGDAGAGVLEARSGGRVSTIGLDVGPNGSVVAEGASSRITAVNGATVSGGEIVVRDAAVFETTNAGGVTTIAGSGAQTGELVVESGGQVRITNLSINSGGSFRISGGSVVARNIQTNGGAVDWTRGNISITLPGTTSLDSTGLFGDNTTVPDTGTLTFADELSLAPAARLSVLGDLTANNGLINAGIIEVIGGQVDGGTPGVQNNGEFSAINVVIESDLINNGQLNLINTTVNGGTSLMAGDTTVEGRLTFAGPVSGPAGIDGSGTVIFQSNYSPGNSPAIVSLGNLAFDSTATLTIELGGTTAGTEFDQLLISGNAALGGDLLVELIDGFTPTNGDTFTILDIDGGLSGMFAGLNEGDTFTADGQAFNITYAGGDGNDVALTAVPEPASLALAVLSLGGLALLRRRR